MTKNCLMTTWAMFEESVKNRFGPSKYEDPKGALSKLLQLGTVEDYQQEFEKLMNRPVSPRLEAIVKKEQNIKEKADTTITLPSEEASPMVKGPLDASEDTLLSLRSEDPNFKIQEKAVKYVRALNDAPLEVVFAGPLDEVSSVIEDVFDIDESNVK
ncbi:reverse transcriptase, partial [Tanacetum coccineum]